MQHDAQTTKKYNKKSLSEQHLHELQQFVLNYCDKKIQHPDKKIDLVSLKNLRETAQSLNLSPTTRFAELSRLLHAVQQHIDHFTFDRRRLSCAELFDFLQKECDKIEECEMTELTAIPCALKNLSEHVDYSCEDILKRKKWGLSHASEMEKTPHLFAYWLAAAKQIEKDVNVPDNHLSRCNNSILRFIGGLKTGCEVIHLATAPVNQEALKKLPIHFNRVFLRYDNRLSFYDKMTGEFKELYIHENTLDELDHILSVSDEVMPVTPAMLKAIKDLTLFSNHVCDDKFADFDLGMRYFSPRNILVALIDGVFNYFEARIDFQFEMIDVLSLILEKGIYSKIIQSIADYIDDVDYGAIRPADCFLQSLMRIGNATTAEELQAIRKKCRPVMDARGIELDKADVEAIINHTPGNPAAPSPSHSRQPSGQGITFAPTINNLLAQSEKPVDSRNDFDAPKDKEDFTPATGSGSSTALLQAQLSMTGQANSEVSADSTGPKSARKNRSIKFSQEELAALAPAQDRWKPWQRVMFAVAIGVVLSAILVGVAAALLYAGPLAHVAIAVGVTATVHWAAAVGVAGVVGTLAGLPVVGAAVGFIAGLFWNRKTEKEKNEFEKTYNNESASPVAVKTQDETDYGKATGSLFPSINSVSTADQIQNLQATDGQNNNNLGSTLNL